MCPTFAKTLHCFSYCPEQQRHRRQSGSWYSDMRRRAKFAAPLAARVHPGGPAVRHLSSKSTSDFAVLFCPAWDVRMEPGPNEMLHDRREQALDLCQTPFTSGVARSCERWEKAVQGPIAGADGPRAEGSRPAHLIIVACEPAACGTLVHRPSTQPIGWEAGRGAGAPPGAGAGACASARHACVWPVHHVCSPYLAMLCTWLAWCALGRQNRAMPMHASTRLLHPPPAPGGSPHALRMQAPSTDHRSTIYAPWWGRRAAFQPLGWNCHRLKTKKRVHSWMVACGLHGPPFSAPTPMLECP